MLDFCCVEEGVEKAAASGEDEGEAEEEVRAPVLKVILGIII